jgi:hypothetical protein
MRQLSEIEKIKYELKFVEKTFSKTIFDDFNSVYEVKIDSNEYQQDWMKLARRFKYSNSGMEMYDGNNVWMKTLPYSTEQIANREEAKADIQEFGYHPGLAIFPEFTTDLIAQLATQNVQVTNLANGEVKVVSDGVTTLFNKYKLPESLSLYPNPNDGVFTVAADLNNNVTISSVKVISVQSGAAINIDHGNQKTFLVNLPNLATGNYVLQVVTSQQKSLTVNFFKN